MRMLAIANHSPLSGGKHRHKPHPAAGAGGLAAHRASMMLSLKDASERSGISGMIGRMGL